MGYPRFQRSRAHKFATRTAGDIDISSTTFVTVDSALDLVIEAIVDDVLEIGLQAQWGAQPVYSRLRAVTLFGASPVSVNLLGDGTQGNPAWLGDTGRFSSVGGSFMYTVKQADINILRVTVRLEARVDTASPKTLIANAASPLHFWVKNLGPIDQT